MNIIIVASDELDTVARKLAHAISLLPDHSASFWTEKHYKDNESTLGGKQRIIFIGENKVSSSYKEILKEEFSAYETTCRRDGSKALLIVTESKMRNSEELEAFKSMLKNKRAELAKRDDYKNNQFWKYIIGGSAFWLLLGPIGVALAGLGMFGKTLKDGHKNAKEYTKMQYEYLILRFMDEVFPDFVGK